MAPRTASKYKFWLVDSDVGRQRPQGLREELEGWQIFFITISSVIGVMIFFSVGEALEMAGPSGALLAFAIVGTVAICVMECVSELVQMFPTPNAVVEFVRIFVDEEYAWVVGVAYWYKYTYASTFATQIFQAAKFTDYWNPAKFYQIAFLYIVAPCALLAINFGGIWFFGVIETIGGLIKIAMVVGGGIYMYVIHGQGDSGSDYINKGFRHDERFAANGKIAGCLVVPIIAYGFLGVETMTVMAFEARDIVSLRRPSRIIAYFVISIYLFCAIGEFLNVDWEDESLPKKNNLVVSRQIQREESVLGSQAIIVIAALKANDRKIAGFLNGCMMFSALSAANTSLYIASRVLYGMTRKINQFSRLGILRSLGSVWNQNGVPVRALCVSFIAFIWLPFLRLRSGSGIDELFEIFSVSASVSCLLVWASLCLAFIRYWLWFRKHGDYIKRMYPEHDRLGTKSQSSTLMAHIQPVPAFVGLIGSLLIIFVFTSATWWSTPPTFRKVAPAYGAPVILTVLFIILKIFSRNRGYVKLTNDLAHLQSTIEVLKSPKAERAGRLPRQVLWRRRAGASKQSAPANGANAVHLPATNA